MFREKQNLKNISKKISKKLSRKISRKNCLKKFLQNFFQKHYPVKKSQKKILLFYEYGKNYENNYSYVLM